MSIRRPRVSQRCCILLAALAVGAAGCLTNSPPSARTSLPVADAYVSEAHPDDPHATGPLRVDGSPLRTALLRFAVDEAAGDVRRATLRIWPETSSPVGVTVHSVADPDWAEDAVTWHSAPRHRPLVAPSGPVRAGTWANIDVTDLLTDTGPLDLALATTSTSSIRFDSREGDHPPELVVLRGPATTSSAPTITPTTVPSPTTAPTTTPPAGTGGHPLIAAAGDIACRPGAAPGPRSCQQEAAARHIDALDVDAVLPLGDTQYDSGTAAEFASYDSSWGRLRSRTRPVPGNHEYGTSGAAGYYGYFGALAGGASRGYYSYDLGDWHLVALNSNCAAVGGCGAGSSQERWLRADLAANASRCTLAYWHHPRFSSGSSHGSSTATSAFWQALQDEHAELVLSGHDHTYERFAPQSADGRADIAQGLRSFVVGTGGKNLYSFGTIQPNSEVRSSSSFGVLLLTLRPDGYDWRFDPVAGGTFSDAGSGSCRP